MKLEKLMQPTQKLEQNTIEEMLAVHPDCTAFSSDNGWA
jgi:hypothetical protein